MKDIRGFKGIKGLTK